MNEITAHLTNATSAVRAAMTLRDAPALADDDLLEALASVEQLGRSVDALRVALAAEVLERSRPALGSERLSTRNGCRNAYELLARVTQVAESTAARRCRLGASIRARQALTGEMLPPRFPAVARAMDAGELGLDTASGITTTLGAVENRAEPGMLEAAEHALIGCSLGVDTATGEQITPFTADQTRIQALQWQIALDPDGVRTREDQAMIDRAVRKLGNRGGVIRYILDLIPEASGEFDRALDSCVSPTTTGRFLTAQEQAEALVTGDSRTPAQQRHDAFVAMVSAAARSAELPTLGGSSPTVLVSVSATELESGTGAGWIDGVDEPVSVDAVKQFICTGGVQKAFFTPNGKLIALGSPERGFTPQQRRAISLRDAGCVIPGCSIPAGWTEIHHVLEHARGGPTHTSNGVMLCWFHHRTIGSSGWEVRMADGVPYVRPPVWIDAKREWRRASKSRATPPPGPQTAQHQDPTPTAHT